MPPLSKLHNFIAQMANDKCMGGSDRVGKIAEEALAIARSESGDRRVCAYVLSSILYDIWESVYDGQPVTVSIDSELWDRFGEDIASINQAYLNGNQLQIMNATDKLLGNYLNWCGS